MKKQRLLLLLSTSFLLTGCFGKINIIDSHNYDSDITDDISFPGSGNSYDDISVPEPDVETTSEYDGVNVTTISEAGSYYFKGDFSSISITASKGSKIDIYLDGINVSSNEGIAFGSSKQIQLNLVILNNSVNTIKNDFEYENAFHIKAIV